MSEMLHVSIKRDKTGSCLVVAKWASEFATESVAFEPDQRYTLAKKQLLQRTPGMTIVSLDAQRPVCITIGTVLFEVFFTGTVLSLFRRYRADNHPPRIGLHLGRDLYREPWELLRDPADDHQGDFLSL